MSDFVYHNYVQSSMFKVGNGVMLVKPLRVCNLAIRKKNRRWHIIPEGARGAVLRVLPSGLDFGNYVYIVDFGGEYKVKLLESFLTYSRSI